MVCVWNIWIDVKLLPDDVNFLCRPFTFSFFRSIPLNFVTYLPVSNFQFQIYKAGVNGNRLSLEPARRSFGFSVSNFHCTVVAICQGGKDYEGFGLVEREVSASNFLHLALAMVMVTFRCFSGHFTDPFLSGVTGVFLHVRCIPHQNSQWLFWASVWFMLDSSWWHEPFGEYLSR